MIRSKPRVAKLAIAIETVVTERIESWVSAAERRSHTLLVPTLT